MTRLYIHSTDPGQASKMNPKVLNAILQRRKEVKDLLEKELESIETITLEVGCGHGHFLTAYGENSPEKLCIGIDVNKGRIHKARKKATRANLINVWFLVCESMEFLELLPSHVSVETTWILYPDPWPKKRHFKNRIVQSRFLEKLAEKTAPGGQLFLRSDFEPYIDWSRELIAHSDDWRRLCHFDWPEIATTVFQELTAPRHHSLVAELKPAKEGH